MIKFLELYIDAVILLSSFYFIGRILFEKKYKNNIVRTIILILLFSLPAGSINMVNSEVLHGVIKIFIVYSLFFIYFKVQFKETTSKTIIASLILYLCLCTSEVIIAILASFLLKNENYSLAFLKNTIVINSLISILLLIIIKILQKKFIIFVKNDKLEGKSNIVIILIMLIALALLIFRIPVDKWNFNVDFVVTMLILLCFCIIGIFMLKQKSDIQKTTSMYQQLVEYSDITNELLEDYRVVSHEHKNQLLIIRSMIENNDKEINDYVDNLLEKRNIIKYQWIGELNHLPLSGLKGLINYKLIEMEKNNINTSISISKDLMKAKLNNLSTKQKDNLYSIMGIYLDNALQAAKNSAKKEVSLEIYKEKKNIIIVLANTYTGTIDLEKIDDYGYTTKGKNHGVGLHIVKRIINDEKIFSQNRNLFEDYYIQELRIHLDLIKPKK